MKNITCLIFMKVHRSNPDTNPWLILLCYTISFRAKDRTLEDKDIQPIMEKILEDLSGMGIELRS